ncbi:hypothetical protein PaeBR_09535 [Paenibacillus sp. BR2-3]|uniref:hypothetical protein n=1 Tax=Paenibacillus sp. BR2-3 TaxID=3048494 RepID=UPI0039775180
MAIPNKQTFVGLRDFALILLTLDTGIRPKEALALTIPDFNANSQEIYITSKALAALNQKIKRQPVIHHKGDEGWRFQLWSYAQVSRSISAG